MIETMIATLNVAAMNETAINAKQRIRVQSICFFLSISLPLLTTCARSTVMDELEVRTTEERVDMEAERTQRRTTLKRILPQKDEPKALLSIVGTT